MKKQNNFSLKKYKNIHRRCKWYLCTPTTVIKNTCWKSFQSRKKIKISGNFFLCWAETHSKQFQPSPLGALRPRKRTRPLPFPPAVAGWQLCPRWLVRDSERQTPAVLGQKPSSEALPSCEPDLDAGGSICVVFTVLFSLPFEIRIC